MGKSPNTRGRPIVALRMDAKEIEHLRAAAVVYGSPDVSSFVREMFSAMLSSDAVERLEFVHRLGARIGKQGALPFVWAQAAAAPVFKAKDGRRGVKGGRQRAKP